VLKYISYCNCNLNIIMYNVSEIIIMTEQFCNKACNVRPINSR